MDTELIWFAEVTHTHHGRKARAFRDQGSAERFVAHWRKVWTGGSEVTLYRIELVPLQS